MRAVSDVSGAKAANHQQRSAIPDSRPKAVSRQASSQGGFSSAAATRFDTTLCSGAGARSAGVTARCRRVVSAGGPPEAERSSASCTARARYDRQFPWRKSGGALGIGRCEPVPVPGGVSCSAAATAATVGACAHQAGSRGFEQSSSLSVTTLRSISSRTCSLARRGVNTAPVAAAGRCRRAWVMPAAAAQRSDLRKDPVGLRGAPTPRETARLASGPQRSATHRRQPASERARSSHGRLPAPTTTTAATSLAAALQHFGQARAT